MRSKCTRSTSERESTNAGFALGQKRQTEESEEGEEGEEEEIEDCDGDENSRGRKAVSCQAQHLFGKVDEAILCRANVHARFVRYACWCW